jgi:ribosome biogenesis protein ENP2
VQETVYDDFKFVTREDLEKLALGHLVGTNMLRAYMHGFFLDQRLYRRAKALIAPFAYEQYRADRVASKLEEDLKKRITVERKVQHILARLVKILPYEHIRLIIRHRDAKRI